MTRGGKLTIGDAYTALFLDGNGKNVETNLNTGVILDVSGEGAHANLENGVLMNSMNSEGYSAAVKIHRDASFEMSGGRISDNHMSTRYSSTYPTSVGGVHIMPGAHFRMTGGSIDNNSGITGGVLVGDLYGTSNSYDKSKFAVFDMEGGIIARNRGNKGLGMGGGVNTFPKGTFNFENGIIAENRSPTGGGIFVSDQYVNGFDGISYSRISVEDYESYLIDFKATLNMNGGLLYKNNAYRTYNPNRSGAGGGIFVSSNHVHLNGGQMLDNYAANMGGGVYVSIVPYTQVLKDILITENHAFTSNEIYHYQGGNGGGIWNCPIGIVHFEDGHSVYVFDNVRYDKNSDLYFYAKNENYRLYRGNSSEVIGKTFYSTLSPITKEGNFIPYIQSGTDGDIPEHMWHTGRVVSVVAPYDARLKAEAWRNARFFVLGNEAQKGGGIGSNANLIAEGEPGDYEIEVRKKWDSGVTNRPDRVQVDLFIGDIKYAEVELGRHNGWRAVFNNLPYTRAELAAKGLSYTVKEHHDDYYVVIEEAYTQPEKNVAVGVLDVLRYISQLDDGNHDPASWYRWYNPMIFVHVVDTDGNVVLTERALLDNFEDQNGQEIFSNTIWNRAFAGMTLNPTTVSYGKDLKFDRFPWANGFDNAILTSYDIFLQEQRNGTYQVQVPHVWLLDYIGEGNYVFRVMENPEQTFMDIPESHVFTLTNYLFHEIPVEKSWHASVGNSDIPESVTVYLLRDGKRVQDENGKDISLTLTGSEDWKGIFEKLPPLTLVPGVYTLEESAPGFIAIHGEESNERMDLVINRAQMAEIDGIWYTIYADYSSIEDWTLRLQLVIDGGDPIPGNRVIHMEDGNVSDTTISFLDVPLMLKKQSLRVAYYLDQGKPFARNLPVYNLLLNKEADGLYTLYLPKLLYEGSSDELFTVERIAQKGTYRYTLENVKEPTHSIDIEKVWTVTPEDGDKVPEQLVITITDKNGKVQTVTLTANAEEALNWKGVLESLAGYYALRGYTITEAALADFELVQQWERLLLAAKPHFEEDAERSIQLELPDGTMLDGKAGVFENPRLSEILLTGNYRYAPYTGAETGDLVIRVEELVDGSFVIHYPAQLALSERLQVAFENSLKPEEPPVDPPDTPEKPPVEPPDTPEEPPVVPPDTPEEPPTIPPETPETPEEPPTVPPDTPETPDTPEEEPEVIPPTVPDEPPRIPPETPETPVAPPPAQPTPPVQPGAAPSTHDPGVAHYMFLALICLLAVARLERSATH